MLAVQSSPFDVLRYVTLWCNKRRQRVSLSNITFESRILPSDLDFMTRDSRLLYMNCLADCYKTFELTATDLSVEPVVS